MNNNMFLKKRGLNKDNKKPMDILLYIIGGVVFLLITITIWHLGRIANYNLSYKSMVKQTIRKMIKPEYLKE